MNIQCVKYTTSICYFTVSMYNGILLSHKKDEIFPFAITWMDLKGIMLSEISQTEKDKYCMRSLICGI